MVVSMREGLFIRRREWCGIIRIKLEIKIKF